MNRTLPLAALALLAAAAPVTAQETEGRLPPSCKRERVEAERPLRGRAAREDSTRKAIDEAAMAELRSAAQAAGVAQPAGLVLLTTDEDRRVVEARVFGGNVPDSVAADAAQRILPRLAAWPDRGRVLTHLRLDTLPQPPAPVGTMQVVCTPQLVNRNLVQQRLQAFASATPYLVQSTAGRRGAQIRMLLDRESHVVHVDLMRTSGDTRLDRFAMELASEMRFQTGSVAGVPRDLIVILPIRVHAAASRNAGAPWP